MMTIKIDKFLVASSLLAGMLLVSACASSDAKPEAAASNAAVAGEAGQLDEAVADESGKDAAADESGKEAVAGNGDSMDPNRLICKIQRPTGSRIGEKVCLTARQWEMWHAQSQREMEKLRRNRPAALSSEG